jgi:hypothetical protein
MSATDTTAGHNGDTTPTPAAISAAQAERVAAERALNAALNVDLWTPERQALRRRCRMAAASLVSLRTAARRAFAEPRGWTVSPTKWAMDYPEVDHAEVYNSHRRAVAVVTHSYATREQIAGYAAEHGLTVEFLPWSWYYPDGCIAAVLTPGAAVLGEYQRRCRGPGYLLRGVGRA